MASRAQIAKGAWLEAEGQVVAPTTSSIVGKVAVGAFSYFGDNCVIGSCRIGRFCSFASSIKVGLGEHPVDTLSSHPIFYGASNGFRIPKKIGIARNFAEKRHAPPIIGHDVWVGANAVITRGVKIGTGAVIGAGAIVTKDVPPYAIVGGVPAKLLRMRFDEKTIADLLASEWWELPIETFVGMPINDIEQTLAGIQTLRAEGVERAVYQKQVIKG